MEKWFLFPFYNRSWGMFYEEKVIGKINVWIYIIYIASKQYINK